MGAGVVPTVLTLVNAYEPRAEELHVYVGVMPFLAGLTNPGALSLSPAITPHYDAGPTEVPIGKLC